MSDRRHDPWHLVIEHPLRVLLWTCALAATGCFGLALIWVLTGAWYALLHWELAVLAVGGFLALVAFVGEHLERH